MKQDIVGSGAGGTGFRCPICHTLISREFMVSEYNMLEVYSLIIQAIGAAINQLPERERRIINSRFGIVEGKCLSLAELGEELHITYERVRQLQKRAVRRIKTKLEEAGIGSSHIQLVLENVRVDRKINARYLYSTGMYNLVRLLSG